MRPAATDVTGAMLQNDEAVQKDVILTKCADLEDGNHRPDLDGAGVVEEFTEVRACDDPGHDSVGFA